MEILLRFDAVDPPTGQLGRATRAGDPADGADDMREFCGWLGLLRALSDRLAEADAPRPPNG